MESGAGADAQLRKRVRQQEVVADLGQRALQIDDLDRLMAEACEVVAETLDNEYATVLELQPDGEAVFLRQGVGWHEGLVGEATVPTDRDSQAGYTLLSEEPVMVDDLRTEDRFSGPELLTDHDVVSGISVIIGSVEDPWGVLGTHDTERRQFTDHDANFVTSVANVLASAIQNEDTRSELEEIYGRISDAFFALDEEWRFTHINEQGHELINPDGTVLEGERIWDQFPEATERKFKPRYERAMYEQETVSFEEYYPEPLDTWFEVRAYPSETGLSVYFTDVSERKERERDLELFRSLLDHSDDSVLVVDPETGRYLDVNETACQRRGYTREEFLERSVPDLETEIPDREAWRSFVAELKTEGQLTVDGRHRRKDGSTYPIELTVSYVELDRPYVLAVARDVTERRARERELEESERRYRTLAECFPNGIVTLYDENLEYTLAAGRAFDDLPVSPAEVEGRPPWEVWGEDTREDLAPAMRAALDGEETAVERSFAGREWMVHAVPVESDRGDVFAGMTMAQDVTERERIERELRESERQLSRLMENVPGVVYRCRNDRGWPMEFVSDACRTVTGYEPEALERGEVVYGTDVVHERDRDELWETIQRTVDDREPFSETYRIESATGEIRWVRDVGRGVFDEDGALVALEGVIVDVTERKRLESELEEIFGRVTDAFYAVDEQWRFTHVNDRAEELIDFTGEGLEGKHVWETFEWAAGSRIREEYERAMETQEPTSFEIQYPEPLDAWYEIHAYPSETGLSVYFRDVTDRKERERELEETERLYQTLVRNFPNGVVALVDRQLRYVTVAGELEVDTDLTRTDIEGGRVPDVLPQELADIVTERYEGALRGESATFEREIDDRVYRFQFVPVSDASGDVFAALGMSQEVTAQIEREERLEELVEQLEASNERLEQFAYAASHDLQEPLRMVSSYLQLIDRRYGDTFDDDGEDFLEYAVDGAERMRAMIAGLLQYSRVDTQGETFEPVDLDEVVDDVLENLQLKRAESDAELSIGSLPRVVGDESQLQQVFQNLLHNAIEYSGDEPPRIRITGEQRGRMATISVSDEGVGIDPAETDRVFEVFQRLHGREEHSGTGIGLALCERIVERHDGEIWVDSEPGEGSTFSFTLPVADEQEP